MVTEAETTAAIQKAAGGATAAFRQTPLANWLRSHNPSGQLENIMRVVSSCNLIWFISADKEYTEAVSNFIKSTAGYCGNHVMYGVFNFLV